jgi:hypothetical protein
MARYLEGVCNNNNDCCHVTNHNIDSNQDDCTSTMTRALGASNVIVTDLPDVIPLSSLINNNSNNYYGKALRKIKKAKK